MHHAAIAKTAAFIGVPPSLAIISAAAIAEGIADAPLEKLGALAIIAFGVYYLFTKTIPAVMKMRQEELDRTLAKIDGIIAANQAANQQANNVFVGVIRQFQQENQEAREKSRLALEDNIKTREKVCVLLDTNITAVNRLLETIQNARPCMAQLPQKKTVNHEDTANPLL